MNELFNATLLKYMSFPNNDLHSVLDGVHIVNLRNLRTLDLGENNFSGKIPDCIGQLKRVEKLHLDYSIMSEQLQESHKNYFNGELTKVDFTKLKNFRPCVQQFHRLNPRKHLLLQQIDCTTAISKQFIWIALIENS
jgi:hypothetical protein